MSRHMNELHYNTPKTATQSEEDCGGDTTDIDMEEAAIEHETPKARKCLLPAISSEYRAEVVLGESVRISPENEEEKVKELFPK